MLIELLLRSRRTTLLSVVRVCATCLDLASQVMHHISRLVVHLLHKDADRAKHCKNESGSIVVRGQRRRIVRAAEVRQLVTPSVDTLIAHCDSDKLHVYNLLTNCEVAEHKLPDTVEPTNIIVLDPKTLLLITTKESFQHFHVRRQIRRAVALVISSNDGFRTLNIREKMLMTIRDISMYVMHAIVIDHHLLIMIGNHHDSDRMSLYSVPLADIMKSVRVSDGDITFRGSYPMSMRVVHFKGSRVALLGGLFHRSDNIVNIIDWESGTSNQVRMSLPKELDEGDLNMLSYYRMPDTWTNNVPTAIGFFYFGQIKFEINLENGTVNIHPPYARHLCQTYDERYYNDDDAVFEDETIPAFTDAECYAAIRAARTECNRCWKDQNHLIVRLYRDRVPSLTRISLDTILKLLSEGKRREITVAHDPSNVTQLVTAILE